MKKLLFFSSLLVVALFTFAFTTNTTVTTDLTVTQATEISHNGHDHALTIDTETNDDDVAGKCIYCGGSAGGTCGKSPHGKCVIHKPGKCSYCGGSAVGTSCSRSPSGSCAIPKDGKCTFCGGSAIGTSCRKSPSGKCSKDMPK